VAIVGDNEGISDAVGAAVTVISGDDVSVGGMVSLGDAVALALNGTAVGVSSSIIGWPPVNGAPWQAARISAHTMPVNDMVRTVRVDKKIIIRRGLYAQEFTGHDCRTKAVLCSP
jgi:hypothetical protein